MVTRVTLRNPQCQTKRPIYPSRNLQEHLLLARNRVSHSVLVVENTIMEEENHPKCFYLTQQLYYGPGLFRRLSAFALYIKNSMDTTPDSI